MAVSVGAGLAESFAVPGPQVVEPVTELVDELSELFRRTSDEGRQSVTVHLVPLLNVKKPGTTGAGRADRRD